MKKSRIIRVNHKFLKFEENGRMLDRYTIFNNCLFRKKIKYLFIGLNPSASNDEFIDDTNTWIVNWILKDGKSGGYFLTNLFEDISTTANYSKKTYNDLLPNILSKYKKLNICVFYGSNIVSNTNNKKKIFDKKCEQILKTAFEENRLYMTAQNRKFHHISMSSDVLTVIKVNDLKDIGL